LEEISIEIERQSLVASLDSALEDSDNMLSLVAPPGYGKSALLKQFEESVGTPGTVRVDLLKCSNHPGLFIDHLVKGVLRWDPDAMVQPLLAVKLALTGTDAVEGLELACRRLAQERNWTQITWLFDRVDSVDEHSAVDRLVRTLIAHNSPQLRVRSVTASRTPFAYEGLPVSTWSQEQLKLNEGEICDVFEVKGLERPNTDALALITKQTDGWPAAVQLAVDLLQSLPRKAWLDYLSVMPLDGGIGERIASLFRHLPQRVQYFARVISVMTKLKKDAIHSLFAQPSDGESLRTAGQMISLPLDKLDGYLDQLVSSRLLNTEEDGWRFNPLLRTTLCDTLKAKDPAVYRELNRRASAYLLKTESTVSPAALEHVYESGDYEELMRLLEGNINHLVRLGHQQKLGRWLDALAEELAELPIWADYELANIHSLRGNWDLSREYLERCRKSLKKAVQPEDVLWLPRINAAYAVMCARRGWASEARTYCRRGLDFIRQIRRRETLDPELENQLVMLQLRLLDRLATNKYSAGLLSKAWDVCTEAREIAAGVGDRSYECKTLAKLGTVAHLRGALSVAEECFRQAYGIAREQDDPIQRVEVQYGRGWNYLDMGEVQEAEELLLEAEKQANALGHTALLWRIRTTLGILYYLTHRVSEARIVLANGYRLADSIGNLGLRGEMLDWYALFLARVGDQKSAQVIFDEAHVFIGGKVRTQQPIAALHKEVEAELFFMEGRVESAIRAYNTVISFYENMGAKMGLIRVHWRLAHIEHLLFTDDRRATPDGVFRHIGAAILMTSEAGAHLPVREEHRELIEIGYRFGGPEVVQVTERILTEFFDADIDEITARWNAKLDDDIDDERTPTTVERYKMSEQATTGLAEYWYVTRDSGKNLTADELEELQESHRGRALTVVLHEQHLDNFGASVSLSQKRVILPLLVHFLRYHNEEFTMAELAERVWKAETLDHSMRTKVKVAISRLRSLLGKGRKYIVTGRRDGEGRRGDVTYSLSPRLEFQLIGRVEDEYYPEILENVS
jgi:ATP/maltotriose-dependent transcriptional regulator MalT